MIIALVVIYYSANEIWRCLWVLIDNSNWTVGSVTTLHWLQDPQWVWLTISQMEQNAQKCSWQSKKCIVLSIKMRWEMEALGVHLAAAVWSMCSCTTLFICKWLSLPGSMAGRQKNKIKKSQRVTELHYMGEIIENIIYALWKTPKDPETFSARWIKVINSTVKEAQ